MEDIDALLNRLERAQQEKEKQIAVLEVERQLLFDAWMKLNSLKNTLENLRNTIAAKVGP